MNVAGKGSKFEEMVLNSRTKSVNGSARIWQWISVGSVACGRED